MSISYYEQNADAFIADTLDVQMQSLYDQVLPHLVAGSHILDAGCGSGRDSRYFLQQGFAVSALDACGSLVKHSRELTGLPVEHCRFDEFVANKPLDAIWACASLLHVPLNDLFHVMGHLTQQLRHDGLFYCSFKYGVGEVSRDGRNFTHLDERGLVTLLQGLPLVIIKTWQTADLRPARQDERWLNALLRKTVAS
jgi:SAM-dependent methyltransferase